MIDHEEVVTLIKDFIDEQKTVNRETLACLTSWKTRVVKMESDFVNCSNNRNKCFETHADFETRMRAAENLMAKMEKIPDKMDTLAIKVYSSMGIMTVLLILAGVWLKRI